MRTPLAAPATEPGYTWTGRSGAMFNEGVRKTKHDIHTVHVI